MLYVRYYAGIVVTNHSYALVRIGEKGATEIPTRQDLRNHSPDGPNWGYSGSGPAQCALAICCDLLGDDRQALRVYQEFKSQYIALLPQGVTWCRSVEEVWAVLAAICRKKGLEVAVPRENPAVDRPAPRGTRKRREDK